MNGVGYADLMVGYLREVFGKVWVFLGSSRPQIPLVFFVEVAVPLRDVYLVHEIGHLREPQAQFWQFLRAEERKKINHASWIFAATEPDAPLGRLNENLLAVAALMVLDRTPNKRLQCLTSDFGTQSEALEFTGP